MNTQQLSFEIEGMTCARCGVQIERVLTQLDGVIAAQVNYATKNATVVYNPTRVRRESLATAVQGAGFAISQEKGQTVWWQIERSQWGVLRRQILPPLAGIGAGLALISLYLVILSIAQSPVHALEQLSQDWFWVGLVTIGFGVQIGLYTYLRLIISMMQTIGSTVMTGAGTTTSTVGMIACCAHHLTDIAPLLGLAGASALSPVVTFLAVWKIPFILFGLAVNAIAIVMSISLIRRERAHLRMMQGSAVTHVAVAPAPTCH